MFISTEENIFLTHQLILQIWIYNTLHSKKAIQKKVNNVQVITNTIFL